MTATQLLAPCTGAELQRLVDARYMSVLIRQQLVAESAQAALAAVEGIYVQLPDASGSNCRAVSALRSSIAKHEFLAPACAFTLQAPHTHWHDNELIVVSRKQGRYLIGPQKLIEHEVYLPVSFCFSDTGPLPYEWADSSVDIDATSFSLCMRVIESLANDARREAKGFGIGLNYRFKALNSEAILPTTEFPRDGSNDSMAAVERTVDFSRRESTVDLVQVGWHPFQAQDPLAESRHLHEFARTHPDSTEELLTRALDLLEGRAERDTPGPAGLLGDVPIQ